MNFYYNICTTYVAISGMTTKHLYNITNSWRCVASWYSKLDENSISLARQASQAIKSSFNSVLTHDVYKLIYKCSS